MNDISILPIPESKYSNYRYNVIFNSYKWDPQVGDTNTVADEVAVIIPDAAKKLAQWAEELSMEVMLLEKALINKPSLYKKLGLPSAIYKSLKLAANYNEKDHVRLMRFDFHPTKDGWVISEVNSDVPGGLSEASLLPKLACELFKDVNVFGNVGDSLYNAFVPLLNSNGRIAFIHATSYSDDRQVMEFLSDHFKKCGFESLLIAPDHIRWNKDEAFCIVDGQKGKVDGLIRFYPGEWLYQLPRSSGWKGYFSTSTPSCNHPIALLAQSKRLPLIWNELDVPLKTWHKLLPETKDIRQINIEDEKWILKPALGRVGEDITIREVITKNDWTRIAKSAKMFPKEWVAQRRFESFPLKSSKGERHLCIGVFTVQGKASGFYGRISSFPRIDHKAQDIAVLVSNKEEI
ncbi:UNVERIFIED_CONTAM: glutathionylspermidine synthase [Acetivibrio alkalicellulosi]